MILISLFYGLFTGKSDLISNTIVSVGSETLEFVLPLLAVTCFFNGIVEIALQNGCICWLERRMNPLLKFLLPDIKNDSETLGYVASNIVINMFGLGSAATPVGLKAIKGMQKHNLEPLKASRSMITFLVLNTGGVTLFPTSIIALRVAYHSLDSTSFIPFAIVSTFMASLIGLFVDRWWNYH
ncbi:MAG: spore maturation protein A [Traorella sp.]